MKGEIIMWKKRIFIAAIISVYFVAAMTLPVSAHGGHHHRQPKQKVSVTCQVCTVEDCTAVGRHQHNNITYCGYDHENGICNGSCAALCEDADCTISGRHTHNGVTYCGYDHENGFCNGSCAAKGSCYR